MKISLCDICGEKIIDSRTNIKLSNVKIKGLYEEMPDVCKSCEIELTKLILQIRERPKGVLK